MKAITRLLCCLGLACSCAGCASTGDPSVDTIGFRPEQAERQRIAPKRAQLRREESGGEAERIRSLTLRQGLHRSETLRRSQEIEIKRLQAQKAASQREIESLNDQILAAQAQGEADEQLLQERNFRQAEVDRLSALLYHLLRSQ